MTKIMTLRVERGRGVQFTKDIFPCVVYVTEPGPSLGEECLSKGAFCYDQEAECKRGDDGSWRCRCKEAYVIGYTSANVSYCESEHLDTR